MFCLLAQVNVRHTRRQTSCSSSHCSLTKTGKKEWGRCFLKENSTETEQLNEKKSQDSKLLFSPAVPIHSTTDFITLCLTLIKVHLIHQDTPDCEPWLDPGLIRWTLPACPNRNCSQHAWKSSSLLLDTQIWLVYTHTNRLIHILKAENGHFSSHKNLESCVLNVWSFPLKKYTIGQRGSGTRTQASVEEQNKKSFQKHGDYS